MSLFYSFFSNSYAFFGIFFIILGVFHSSAILTITNIREKKAGIHIFKGLFINMGELNKKQKKVFVNYLYA